MRQSAAAMVLCCVTYSSYVKGCSLRQRPAWAKPPLPSDMVTFGSAMKKGFTLAGRYPVALRYLSTSQRSANSFSLLSNLLATITCSSGDGGSAKSWPARQQKVRRCLCTFLWVIPCAIVTRYACLRHQLLGLPGIL
jgi:hypothetical protein